MVNLNALASGSSNLQLDTEEVCVVFRGSIRFLCVRYYFLIVFVYTFLIMVLGDSTDSRSTGFDITSVSCGARSFF